MFRRWGPSFGSARTPAILLAAALVALAVSCSTTPGGGGSGSTSGRINAIPRDAGPCGPDAPMSPSGYFARADVTDLPVRPNSADWVSTLAGWNTATAGNLAIHWGNGVLETPTRPDMYEGYVYSYPVNFVNTTVPANGWEMERWQIGLMGLTSPPVFEAQSALMFPEEGDYPKLRSTTGVQAWHLGSPDYWAAVDRMVFVRDSGTCRTYELMGVHRDGTGTAPNAMFPFDPLVGGAVRATGGVIWEPGLAPESYFRDTYWEPRGVGAAAIPISPMVLRFDEVARNAAANPVNPLPLDHALYWASAIPTGGPCSSFVWPARHADCGAAPTDPTKPAQGAWLRLRSDFPDSAYGPQMKVVIRTLKTRGMVFADGTAPNFKNGIFAEPAGCQAVGGVSVQPSDASKCWTSLDELSSMPIGLTDFEVIDPTDMRLDPNLVGGRADQADPADLWKCSPSFDCG